MIFQKVSTTDALLWDLGWRLEGQHKTELIEQELVDFLGVLRANEHDDSLQRHQHRKLGFFRLLRLTSVTLEPGVKNIGNRAFAFCTGLTGIG